MSYYLTHITYPILLLLYSRVSSVFRARSSFFTHRRSAGRLWQAEFCWSPDGRCARVPVG